MDPIGRVISFFAPERALRRHRARVMLSSARAYEGAARTDGWRVRRAGASANTDHAADARELRNRARSLVQNVPYCARAAEVRVSALVGTGITPNFEGRNAAKLNKLWKRHAKVIDADGQFDAYGIEAAAVRAMDQDGEVLIRRRHRRTADGLPVPFQVQVLEIDWLDSNKTSALKNGGRIINGIEYDAIGRVHGYWLYDSHPGEALRGVLRLTSRFVPARDIIHLFSPKRPGQGRGVTRFAPIIARVRDFALYEDAELARKNLEARLGVLVSYDPERIANTDSPLLAGAEGGLKDGFAGLGELPSGGVTQIPAGSETTLVEPKAVAGYFDYCVLNLHLISSGYGVPFESMTGYMKLVNFSSARIRLQEFRRDIEQDQWLVVIPRLCEPLAAWFVEAAVLAGEVDEGEWSVDWSTPRWEYVNPAQDIKAEVDAIGAGVLTPSESLRKRGYDPNKVFTELGSDFKELERTGALELMRLFMTRGRDEASAPHTGEN